LNSTAQNKAAKTGQSEAKVINSKGLFSDDEKSW